jgi:hypothetical protein
MSSTLFWIIVCKFAFFTSTAIALHHLSPCSASTLPLNLASLPATVQDGNQFAAALRQERIHLVCVSAPVISITESAWNSSEIVLLTRNITVMGDTRLSSYPTLQLNYVKEKVWGLAVRVGNDVSMRTWDPDTSLCLYDKGTARFARLCDATPQLICT